RLRPRGLDRARHATGRILPGLPPRPVSLLALLLGSEQSRRPGSPPHPASPGPIDARAGNRALRLGLRSGARIRAAAAARAGAPGTRRTAPEGPRAQLPGV